MKEESAVHLLVMMRELRFTHTALHTYQSYIHNATQKYIMYTDAQTLKTNTRHILRNTTYITMHAIFVLYLGVWVDLLQTLGVLVLQSDDE